VNQLSLNDQEVVCARVTRHSEKVGSGCHGPEV
jgi:hypothetical protein